MLAEWFQYLTTPCPAEIRALGYLKQAIGFQARHRRCAEAWRPHLEQCHLAIEEAIALCDSRRRAVVVGSGLTIELPLENLASEFDEVVLIDAVQLRATKRAVRAYGNVELQQRDVTGLIAPVWQFIRAGSVTPLPQHVPGDLLVDPPDLLVSCNLLSQLPLLMREALESSRTAIAEEALDSFCRGIVSNHLIWLHAFPGQVCLITDRERLVHDGERVVDREDALFGVDFPYRGREWFWDLAPQPEIHRRYGLRHRMIAIPDLRAANR